MYINLSLLFIFALALVFSPTAQEWVSSSAIAWYRPWLLWALVILLGYLNQRGRYSDDR